MNRRKIVAGNWKMNMEFEEGMQLARQISHMNVPDDVRVVLGVPSVYIKAIVDMLLHVPSIDVAAQNCHQEVKGAFTGEISAAMLESISCPYVILGHSERRAYFSEDDALLAKKVDIALSKGLQVIFCCGEPLEIRKAGSHIEYVTKQIENSLFHLEAAAYKNIVIAYEPIWAIGTGETASPEQAQDMHKALRSSFAKKYSSQLADDLSILYGGSVKAKNAKELFGQPDVDGGLVGGASLDAEQFQTIITSY